MESNPKSHEYLNLTKDTYLKMYYNIPPIVTRSINAEYISNLTTRWSGNQEKLNLSQFFGPPQDKIVFPNRISSHYYSTAEIK